MSPHADYKRRRREQSQDFKLYEAAKMQASRERKKTAAVAARVEDAEKESAALKAIVERLVTWPLLDGMRAGQRGLDPDPQQSSDWKRGYEIGRRK